MVAALSASAGIAVETDGSSSRDWLSFIDSMGSVDSAAASVPGPAAANWPVGDGSETNPNANSEWWVQAGGGDGDGTDLGGLLHRVQLGRLLSKAGVFPPAGKQKCSEGQRLPDQRWPWGGVDPGADLLSETCSCLMTSISSSCNPETTAVSTCERRPDQ